MATEAQVTANRRNAKKSTGPRTDEGKEKASQNSIKHGLLAREAVIRGEDWEEYEIHREGLMDQLRPESDLEVILASRVVDLTWRLQRVGRDRNEVFGALWDRRTPGAAEPTDARERGAMIGTMLLDDLLEEAVLDRLDRYERRIESSLYRTLKELRTIYDRSRMPDPQLEATLARWRQEDDDAKKRRIFARCEAAKAQAAAEAQATAAAEGATNEMCETKPKEESVKCDESSVKKEETPCGVTHGRDGHATKGAKRTQFGEPGRAKELALGASERRNKALTLLAEVKRLCETKPIEGPGAREAALRIIDCGLQGEGRRHRTTDGGD